MATGFLYTLSDLLKQHAHRDSKKVALVDGAEQVTYTELCDRVESLAVALRQRIDNGDRVAIFLRRSIDLVVALLAVSRADGVVVIVNDRLRSMQVEHILQHSQASVLISDEAQLKTTPGLRLGETQLLDTQSIERSGGDSRQGRMISRDLAMIIYTSGSSGMPKGVMLSHENLLAGAHSVADYLELSDRDRLISVLPFSFDYGLNQLLTMLLLGGTLVIQRSMLPAEICRTLTRERITGMAGVPLFWSQLADRFSPFLKTSFPDLRYITNSGGSFPIALIEKYRKAHPELQLFLMYGLTEAFRSTYLPPDQVDIRPSSIGKAIPNAEILVIDDEGKRCGPGVPGELVHRGVHVAMGYWRDPQTTARVFRKNPVCNYEQAADETVVYSGDFVKSDEDGYLYFLGRRDQLIKSQGVRVSAEEIEHYLYASAMVAVAAAFAVPSAADSDIVVAVVAKDPDRFDPEVLGDFCRREMPGYMQPAKFWQVEDVPQTSSGKIDRQQIKAAYLAEH